MAGQPQAVGWEHVCCATGAVLFAHADQQLVTEHWRRMEIDPATRRPINEPFTSYCREAYTRERLGDVDRQQVQRWRADVDAEWVALRGADTATPERISYLGQDPATRVRRVLTSFYGLQYAADKNAVHSLGAAAVWDVTLVKVSDPRCRYFRWRVNHARYVEFPRPAAQPQPLPAAGPPAAPPRHPLPPPPPPAPSSSSSQVDTQAATQAMRSV